MQIYVKAVNNTSNKDIQAHRRPFKKLRHEKSGSSRGEEGGVEQVVLGGVEKRDRETGREGEVDTKTEINAQSQKMGIKKRKETREERRDKKGKKKGSHK